MKEPASSSLFQALLKQKRKQFSALWVDLVPILVVICVAGLVYLDGSIMAYAVFGFPLVLVPYTMVQRRIIEKMPTLRHELNDVRYQVNQVGNLAKNLQRENELLEAEVTHYSNSTKNMEKIASKSGFNLNELHALIDEKAETQRQMKELKDAQKLQGILKAILLSDTNHDNRLSELELDCLRLRLENFHLDKYKDIPAVRQALQMSGTEDVAASKLFRSKNAFSARPRGNSGPFCHRVDTDIDSLFAYKCL